MRATTICLINQKGGCGKSSTCFHLAGSYARKGRSVLLIDADPQGSLSQGFFGSAVTENLPASETLAALFDDDFFLGSPETLAVPTHIDRVSIVRANQTLARHNTPTPELAGLTQYALREFLESLTGYDLVLIDCPPNLYQCSWNAMLAADFVVIPVPPEDFGTQGLRVVHQAVVNAHRLNPELDLLGHVVTRYDARLLVHQSYEKKLRGLYGETMLDTVIPEASAFKVSLACRQPVSCYSPASKAAALTDRLADELMERIGRQAGQQNVA
ncbi:MAG: ParA family protein [Planctomycetota bacterium]|nr:ParA family protein [Planctomycetaceae bacterium]MDQ3333045.1 ParA family protein [Planctomycetota bacterium]